MLTDRRLLVALALLTVCSGASVASAQQQRSAAPAVTAFADTIHLVFDQATRTVKPASQADARLIAAQHEMTISLRKPANVQLTVVQTNTALFDVVVADSVVVMPPAFGISSSSDIANVLSAAHSFFPQALGVFTSDKGNRGLDVRTSRLPQEPPIGSSANMKTALTVAKDMERSLDSLDELFAGPRSVASVRGQARAALQRMRDTTPEGAAQSLRHSLGWGQGQPCRATSGDTLALSGRLLSHYQALRPRADTLARALADPGFKASPTFRDSLESFRMRADSAIRAAQLMTDAAYATEHLVTIISGACSRQEMQRRPAATGSNTQKIVVNIARRAEPDIAPVVADLRTQPTVAAITVVPPRPLASISAGVSLIMTPSARFGVYSTRTDSVVGAKGVQIYRQNTTDARYSWGATVGVSWRFLDWSETSRFALWIPEVTIMQVQGTSGFAVGSAISWKTIKIGAGAAWVQHSALQGNSVGDHIPNAGYLQLTSTYGAPNGYLSVSVFGVPGFGAK